jgi:hypothetical protein
MEKLTEFVDGKEVRTAVYNWNKIMKTGPDNLLFQNWEHKSPYFSTFVKPHELVSSGHGSVWGWKVSEYNYRKIKMLASPHHYALLKAFKARTGWQGVIPNEKA